MSRLRVPHPIHRVPHALWCVALAMVCALTAGCSARTRKLSTGGATDVLFHDILGQDRNPDYYYSLLRDSHDPNSEAFAYRTGEDKFLVDKNVDAAEKLGHAEFARLEGQAMAVVILSHMVLEDPAALARTNAATSLTKIGLRLPRYGTAQPGQPVERGERLLASIRQLDAMHNEQGQLRHPSYQARVRTMVQAVGHYNVLDLEVARNAVKPFFTRDYLIDATDPALRTATDTALVMRMERLIRLALRAGLDDPVSHTRRQCIIGLKTLNDRGAEASVLGRMQIESDWQVQAEAIEYLGKLASVDGLAVLVDTLNAPDPTLRHKSRQALIRVAGRDYGPHRSRWLTWARARFPDHFREREAVDPPPAGLPGTGPGPSAGVAPTPDDGPLPPAPDDGPLPPVPDEGPLPPVPDDGPLPPAPDPAEEPLPPPAGIQ